MARRWTTSFAAFRRLYELLRDSDHAALADVTCVWGHPGENPGEKLLSVGRVEPADQDAAALGQRRREERYSIEALIDVAFRADSHAAVNDACEAIVQAVEEVVHTHPTLDGALYADGIAEIGGHHIEAVGQLESGAFQTLTIINVDCTARI